LVYLFSAKLVSFCFHIAGLFFRKFPVFFILIAAVPTQTHADQEISEKRLAVFVNPLRRVVPSNEWHVAVWSLSSSNISIRTADHFPPLSDLGGAGLVLLPDNSGVRGLLDTKLIPTPVGRLATVVLKRDFVPGKAAWNDGRDGMTFSAPLRIDKSEFAGDIVAYVGATFVFYSPRTNRSFWLQVQLFDTRGSDYFKNDKSHFGDRPSNDRVLCSPSRSTRLPILSAVAGDASELVTFAAASPGLMSRAPADGLFTFFLSKANMRSMLSRLAGHNQWCASEGDYDGSDVNVLELRQASIMVEIQFGKSRPGEIRHNDFSILQFQLKNPKLSFK
jgi:hypothetical protein